MSTKTKYLITETSLGLCKFCFVLGTVLGGIAVCVAATVPDQVKPKINTGRRSYL